MVISILHNEKQVQLRDLTRFDATKSILVKGSANPINSVKIKPGADATEIDVYNSDPKKWFLDWAFSQYAFDVDTPHDQVAFEHDGDTYFATIPANTYDLATLTAEIENQIIAAVPTLVIAVVEDTSEDVSFIKFVTADTTFKLLPNKPRSIMKHLGFKEDGQLVGFPVEYGLRKVTVTVGAGTSSPFAILETASVNEFVEVYTEEGDALFSEDSDFVSEEPDIMKWLPAGRGSFRDLHRKAQRLILDWCDRQGYRDELQNKITKWAFVDNSDVRLWSYYSALRLFFMGAQNDVDDVFKNKSKYYEKLEISSRDRAVLNLDLDGDKKADVPKGPDIRSGRLFLR